ncbi:MAG: hypothetical protein N3C59_01995 [Azovibrio sp.]|nr:hypothetical protein [Azovibrio sp.]
MVLPIVLIGWLYVTLLMAATETSFVAALLTFTLYGGIPCALMLYFAGSKVRRERALRLEQQSERAAPNTRRAAPH